MDLLGLLFVFLLATVAGSFWDMAWTRRYDEKWATSIAGGMFGASLLNAIAGNGEPVVGGVHVFWAAAGAVAGVIVVEFALHVFARKQNL